MNFANLTPHAIVVRTSDGDITLEPTTPPARVQNTAGNFLREIDGVPIFSADVPGKIEGIPPLTRGHDVCRVSRRGGGAVARATRRGGRSGPRHRPGGRGDPIFRWPAPGPDRGRHAAEVGVTTGPEHGRKKLLISSPVRLLAAAGPRKG